MLDQIISLFGLTALASVVAASLVGSHHCAGMCGPLSLLVSSTWGENLSYNFGRLVSYSLLGGILGHVGDQFFNLDDPRLRGLGIGLMLALIFYSTLRMARGRTLSVKFPKGFDGILQNAFRISLKSSRRSLLIGLLTVFLPCGWLWTFIASAMASGHAESGTMILAGFWLGSLPVMTFFPMTGFRMLQPLLSKFPKITALAFATLSLTALALRYLQNQSSSCH